MSASFRQHLALAFLIYPGPLNVPPSSPGISSLIHDHLDTSPDYFITRRTDYASLAARLSLLDIGIGPGPTTIPYALPPPQEESETQTLPHPKSLTAEEIAFNKEIDDLVRHIKLISNKFVQAGAISDLTRLQAKNCSEQLCRRLENAARIGGRRKTMVFSREEDTEVGGGNKGFLSNWMGRNKARSRSGTPVVNGEGSKVAGNNDDDKGIGTIPERVQTQEYWVRECKNEDDIMKELEDALRSDDSFIGSQLDSRDHR